VTVKQASKLKKGDRVALTRDDRVWRVDWIHAYSERTVELHIKCDEFAGLTLSGAAALRSLKSLEVGK
jgi:hypothetical protein